LRDIESAETEVVKVTEAAKQKKFEGSKRKTKEKDGTSDAESVVSDTVSAINPDEVPEIV